MGNYRGKRRRGDQCQIDNCTKIATHQGKTLRYCMKHARWYNRVNYPHHKTVKIGRGKVMPEYYRYGFED